MPTVCHKRNLKKTIRWRKTHHVEALTVSEQVPLMACKVNVTAVDESSTTASAL